MKKLIEELKNVRNLWCLIIAMIITLFAGEVIKMGVPGFLSILMAIVVFGWLRRGNKYDFWAVGATLLGGFLIQLIVML